MSYKVYGFAGSRSIRVTWMLEELGLDYEFIDVRPHSPEILALNPAGKIPVLEVAGKVISDSAAICLYLCDAHPEKGLSAQCGTLERAQIDSWLFFAQSELEPPIWAYRKHKKSTKFSLIPDELKVDLEPWAKFEFAKATKTLLAHLGDKPYAMGNNFSISDIFLTQIGQWARYERFEIPTRYKDYLDMVWARPALDRARKKEASSNNSD